MSRNDQPARVRAVPIALAGAPRRLRWSKRWSVPAVLALVLLAATFDARRTILSAAESERQESLRGNAALAGLASQLIDQKCETIRLELNTFGANEHAAIDAQVELYGSDGLRLATYSSSDPDHPAIARDEIRKAITDIRSSGHGVFNRSNAKGVYGFAIAVPLDESNRADRIVVASYRTEVLDDWLRPLQDEVERTVYVIDREGRALIPAGNRDSLNEYALLGLAEKQGRGRAETLAPLSTELGLIGFARARVPQWTVLVVEPKRAALAPMKRLRNRLLVAGAVIVFVIVVAAWLVFVQLRSMGVSQPPGGGALPARRLQPPVVPPPLPRVPAAPSPAPRVEPRQATATPPPIPAEPHTPPVTIFANEGAWKVVSMSVTGRSHARTGMPCQDTSFCKVLNGNMLIAAVADGAGSALHGDQGARVAAQRAVETLVEDAAALEPSDSDDQWNRVMLAAMNVARSRIEMTAASRNKPTRQLATTLILFVAMPEMIVAAQIGDGAIVFRDEHGDITSLTRPKSGEYINTTTFLVSPDAFKAVQHGVWRRPYTDIAAFTDGLQMLALSMPQGEPHSPFFLPLFEFVGKASQADEALGELGGFLTSPRITDRADDDLTLLLAHFAR